MASATETLNKARSISKGMAEWVDGQRAAGWSDHTICTMLKEAADVAQDMQRQTSKSHTAGEGGAS